MVVDRFNIEMEDISQFKIERSCDHSFWETVSHDELTNKIFPEIAEEKLKRFLGVVRNGGMFKLGDYFYRIQSS